MPVLGVDLPGLGLGVDLPPGLPEALSVSICEMADLLSLSP